MPHGAVELIVNYGDPFFARKGNAWAIEPQVSVVGPRTRAVEVRASGRTGLIIVRFQPWAANLWRATPLSELRDRNVSLEEVLGEGFRSRLVNQVGAKRTGIEKANAVVGYIWEQFGDGAIDKAVQEAIHRIRRSDGRLGVAHLAGSLGLSRRQLLRRFDRHVGLSPKQFAANVRFQKALSMLRAGLGWSAAVDQCGYYDQSHFIHAFSRHAQITPGDQRVRGPGTRLSSYFSRMSHSYNTPYL